MREALIRLVAEGMAVHVPYKGVRTPLLSPAELRDVYELRALLEGFAVELAARRITGAELAKMRELLPRATIQESERSAADAWEADREFHLIAVRACGRPHLTGLIEQILDLTNPYGVLGERRSQEQLADAVQESGDHAQILESLEASDGKLARELVVNHLHKSLDHLILLLGDSARERTASRQVA